MNNDKNGLRNFDKLEGGLIFNIFVTKCRFSCLMPPPESYSFNHILTNVYVCSIFICSKEYFMKMLRGPQKMGFCMYILALMPQTL